MVAPMFRMGSNNHFGPSDSLKPPKKYGNIPKFLNPSIVQNPENAYSVGLGPYQLPRTNARPKDVLPQFMWHPIR